MVRLRILACVYVWDVNRGGRADRVVVFVT
jgi:hypothetical protein